MPRPVFVAVALAGLIGGLVLQQRSIHALRQDLASQAARQTANASAPAEVGTPAPPDTQDSAQSIRVMQQRLDATEEQVRQLMRASEVLMEKGELPLSETKAAELRSKFLNSTLSAQERLQALRLLRQNQVIDDELIKAGMEWLGTLTDPRIIGDLLGHFAGLKSPLLRDGLLPLAAAHPEARVRAYAVHALSGMIDDPSVEFAFWNALRSEQHPEVQEQLGSVLAGVPVTPERQARLQLHALDQKAPFTERLIAFRALESAKVADAKTTAAFVNDVVARNQSDEMRVLFRQLDNTGNLAAVPALIKGLRMTEPELRALALDALSEMQSDPAVVQWLRHSASNDTDERVRAEAVRVLAQGGNTP